ncbi:hypothetical protein Tco_0597519 [Tanacetum coccineum]
MENTNPSSPPGSPTSRISRRVRKLDMLLESLGKIIPPPISEPSYLEGEPKFELVIGDEESEELEEEVEERVRGLKVFVGNFTYECDFVVLEDTTSVIDHYLGGMELGKLFVKESRLVYDKDEGTVVTSFERVTLSLNRRHIAELEALGQRGDTLKALKGLREIVARDVVKLGVLEQLLAATLVGIPLKAGYVADMEDKE